MKTATYLHLVTFLAAALLLSAVYSPAEESGATGNEKTIKFDHSLHAMMSACDECHMGAAEAETLSDRLLPEKDNCAVCHDVEDGDLCEDCHYEDVYEALVQPPSELIFSHAYHVSEYEMACEDCHVGLDEVAFSYEAEQPNPPMESCYVCHNNEGPASNECATCHISTVGIIPADHKQTDFPDNHKFTSQMSNANCAMCHDEQFCGACHEATTLIDESNTAFDFFAPYVPDSYVDNHKMQKITRVHDLNYRYSHGIDARSKTSECRTCHQVETFCAECHGAGGGDYALGGVTPSTHFVADFVTIGVGAGGGEHATLARRDIESCASCHDTRGADPNCILCHVDPDGIPGTNPRTHAADFMIDTDGDWHSNEGSVCYNCHTDANAHPNGNTNQGFCSYCH